jgi:hypothetical protein
MKDEMGWLVVAMGGQSHKILVRKTQGKRLPARERRIWENNLKCVLKIGCEGVDWIQMAQIRSNSGLL